MSGARARLSQGTGLLWFDILGSTNDEAKRLAAQGETGPLWIVAEHQDQGRGRQGRVWSSPPGNLAATYLFAPALSPGDAARLSFVAALAVADVIESYCPGAARLKWPNDVLVGSKKIAGILLESAGRSAQHVGWLAIGIGINLQNHPVDTPFPATSLVAEGAKVPPLREAVDRLAAALDRWLAHQSAAGFAAIREAWLARGPKKGAPLTLRLGAESIPGAFEDLNAEGALIIRDAQGALHVVTAGEVFPHG